MPLKILTVVGARPQFIKAAGLSRYIADQVPDQVNEVIVHTGQHYDANMSDVFFEELGIPRPDFQLSVSSSRHGASTGQMLGDVEDIILSEKPDWVLVYGDTNSTLAGALAAAKLHVPVAHVEAGLRSFNKRMPEEINRIMSDHVSTRLYCPTETAVKNLAAEGIVSGVSNVGDIMYEVTRSYAERPHKGMDVMERLGLGSGEFVLVTIHRAENTDDEARLKEICAGLGALSKETKVVFPMHPRTRKCIENGSLWNHLGDTVVLDPLAYLELQVLQKNARTVFTDSGGIQKEVFFCQTPCVTVRDETEWLETVDAGWNRLVQADAQKIHAAVSAASKPSAPPSDVFGLGNTSELIIRDLLGTGK